MNNANISGTHLVDYLNSIGCNPVKIQYGNAWYLSPFRAERTASFKINLAKNLWYDFGTGEGGTLIDFVMKMSNQDYSGAIALVTSSVTSYSAPLVNSFDDGSGKIKIEQLQQLAHPALQQYLRKRGIKMAIAKQYLQQAIYSVHGKNYFALAFGNDKGGYELRNSFFKTGSSPKYLSTIAGKDETRLNVYEGFMDFLSCCCYYNSKPQRISIILNSLSFLPRIESSLGAYKSVNLYLDNDSAGRTATQSILNRYSNAIDHGQLIYPKHKDFNEFWMN